MERVLIAGGGIAGLCMALTLDQIGVPCTVYESTAAIRPLGVGINLQPNAVRELYDLGIGPSELDRIGIPCREWALVGRNGHDIHTEPRGIEAGYRWPQYSVHRGQLQVLLYQTVIERLGPEAVQTGSRVVRFEQDENDVTAFVEDAAGVVRCETGTLLTGADGIRSTVRAQLYPDQPPVHWSGANMWRGTARAKPVRTGASFVGLGSDRQRLVFYPISYPDPATGLAIINWIAEVTLESGRTPAPSDWTRRVEPNEFLHHFEDWRWDWLDVPALVYSTTDEIYEYPMVDRDPVSSWVDGRVALIGDAAHPMYPTGSNGASQAIVDTRVLGASILDQGLGPEALAAFDAQLCEPVSQVVLRNRGAGPFGILALVDQRCGGEFDDIDRVIPREERDAFMAAYKRAAGLDIERLNAAPPTISPGPRLS